MLNEIPPSSRTSSFSNPFRHFRKCSKASRLASKDDTDKVNPTDAAPPSSNPQTQSQSQLQTDHSLPPTTTTLLTVLHASLVETPPSDRKIYIETLQKLLNTISLCPELTCRPESKSETKSESKSESNSPTNTCGITSLSIFHKRAYEYITKGVREDRTTVVFVREEGCEFCEAVKSSIGRSEGGGRRRKGRLSKTERSLVDSWRRGRVCLCGGEDERKKERERAEKEKRDELANDQAKTRTNSTQDTNSHASEAEQQHQGQDQVSATTSLPPTPAPSALAPTEPEPEFTPEQQKAHQERERLRYLRMQEHLRLRDAELRLLVPKNKRPPPYGRDQPPGLDGYSATQEREEEYGYLSKFCSTLNPNPNSNGNSTYERISDCGNDFDSSYSDEESRHRGRSVTRRERTGYGIPYNNNRTNGTTSYISHQDCRSEFHEERTGYGVPYGNNRSNGTTPHPATLNLEDNSNSSSSHESRTHSPSSDSISRPSQHENQHQDASHFTTALSSSAAYTMPSGGLRSFTSPYTSSYTPSLLQSAPNRLTSTGTDSRSTSSSYIAPRHSRRPGPGTHTNTNKNLPSHSSSYSSSYYSSRPSSQLALSSTSTSTSTSTSASGTSSSTGLSLSTNSTPGSGCPSTAPSTSTSISRKGSRDHGDGNGDGDGLTRKP